MSQSFPILPNPEVQGQMPGFFVTATGTDIGKTFVTAGLIRSLRRRGLAAAALKPVVSGFDPAQAADSDPARLLAALGREMVPAELDRIAPFRFRAPLAPDMAAAREGRRIDFAALAAIGRGEGAGDRWLFVEGVGGVMVPLDESHTVLDWIEALGLPAILVAGSYLGTISHTLTALSVLAARALPVAAVVISESARSLVPLDETVRSVARFAGALPVLAVPRRMVGRAEEPAFDAIADRLSVMVMGRG